MDSLCGRNDPGTTRGPTKAIAMQAIKNDVAVRVQVLEEETMTTTVTDTIVDGMTTDGMVIVVEMAKAGTAVTMVVDQIMTIDDGEMITVDGRTILISEGIGIVAKVATPGGTTMVNGTKKADGMNGPRQRMR